MPYKKEFQTAIDFIEENLTQPIDSLAVVRQTNYSSFHFYKLFSLFVGMSIKDYIRRRRLTHAAYDLLTTSDRIIDIAFKYCFESQESFTRSFKQVFGITPKKYRIEKPYIEFLSKRGNIDFHYLFQYEKVTPNIITRSTFTVIGIESMVDILESPNREVNQIKIPQMWEVFLERKDEIKGQLSPHSYGISLPQEDGLNFKYLACVEVDPKIKMIPRGMVMRQIPSNTYAVFRHKEGVEKIINLLKWIHKNWIMNSNITLKTFPEIEIYYDSKQDHIEICLPVFEESVDKILFS